jgi:2,4-diketo-3-deoxy-L-fuconate hydrolase
MKKFAIALSVLLVGWLLTWQLAAHWSQATARPVVPEVPAPDMNNLSIAPRKEALTFARYLQEGEPRLLLVESISDGQVTGVDLQLWLPDDAADPITLFRQLGYQALQTIDGPAISVDISQLILPFIGTDNQVAVGINYPAHSEETAVADSFLFPKRTAATPFAASVVAGDHLLDYELELGFVLLEDLPPNTQPDYIGLVLASDYTDRAALMRSANLTDISSGEGFTTGKSFPGFMPLGNLLVIPKDYQQFYPALLLELWYNGERRQQARPSLMIWDWQRIIAETFAQQDRRWQWQDSTVALPVENGSIPQRTVFLSGTPGGVVYQKPGMRQLFLGASEMFFTLQWLNPQSVIEPFVREEYRSGRYLKQGDLVQMRAERLGTISNAIASD